MEYAFRNRELHELTLRFSYGMQNTFFLLVIIQYSDNATLQLLV